jgi:hypothetical protein
MVGPPKIVALEKIAEAVHNVPPLLFDVVCVAKLQCDSLVGANICASTALDAGVSVNNINITGRNSLYGALANAATTSYTFLGINFVSHNLYWLKSLMLFC